MSTQTTLRPIVAFQVVDHGIDYAQYFQGCGVSFTEFEECATGCGDNPREAIDDALESLAQAGEWDVDGMDARILKELGVDAISETPSVSREEGDDDAEAHYYVSIRVR